MSFMPHVFNQNKHPFDQCEYFSQVEPFEKPWFVVMSKMLYVSVKPSRLMISTSFVSPFALIVFLNTLMWIVKLVSLT